MARIQKGDRLTVAGAPEPLVASRDEYNSRVYAMTVRDSRRSPRRGHRADTKNRILCCRMAV